MVLTTRILDRSRAVLVVLPKAFDVRYSRRPLSATEVLVSVPRDSPGLEHAVRGSLLEVWRGNNLEASGRLELRDVSGGVVTLTAYTEEILLKDVRLPASYGAVFSGMDAADVIRSCLDGWAVKRIKAAAEWAAPTGSSKVTAVDAGGGTLWLTRDGAGKYERNGYAYYRFNSSEFPGFKSWDRIRWASDYPPDGLVYTTVQYRFGTSGTWLPSVTWPSEGDPSQTLTGERGVLTDELGLSLGAATNSILEVRCNLFSDDQDSQEEGEVGTSGTSPRFYALEVVARTTGSLTVGSIPASTGVTMQAVNADAATAFDVIRDACEQARLDFQVVQGQLVMAEAFGLSLTSSVNLVTSEGRAALTAPSTIEVLTLAGEPITFESEFITVEVPL